jgi:hypothetical protein
MSGWIKLHRQLNNHWLYTEKRKFSKLEAWIDILFTVNFADTKTVIKGKLIEVKRGESILSLDSWSKRWNWDKSAVRRFFDMLQSDGMIALKSETVTTRLTICNYESYQSEETKSETQMKRKRNADETHLTLIEEGKKNKEGKEGEEDNNKFDFKKSLLSLGIQKSIVEDWLKIRKKKSAVNSETAFNLITKEINKTNLSANDCISECVMRSWSGFKAEWINKQQNNFNNGTTTQPRRTLDDQVNDLTARVLGINPEQSTGTTSSGGSIEEADFSVLE